MESELDLSHWIAYHYHRNEVSNLDSYTAETNDFFESVATPKDYQSCGQVRMPHVVKRTVCTCRHLRRHNEEK